MNGEILRPLRRCRTEPLRTVRSGFAFIVDEGLRRATRGFAIFRQLFLSDRTKAMILSISSCFSRLPNGCIAPVAPP